jgi:hypothetical protein
MYIECLRHRFHFVVGLCEYSNLECGRKLSAELSHVNDISLALINCSMLYRRDHRQDMAAAESCQSSESPVDVDSSCSHDRVYCPNCLCELSCKDGPFVDTQQSGGDDTQGDVPEDDSGNSETDGRLFDKLKKRFTKSGKQSKKTDPNNSTLCAGCQKPVAWNSGDATVLPVDDTVERYTQHLAGSESGKTLCLIYFCVLRRVTWFIDCRSKCICTLRGVPCATL